MPDLVFFAQGSTTPLGTEGAGATLVLGTTYYADLSFENASMGKGVAALSAVQWKWDASIIITSITIETTNFDEGGTTLSEAAGSEWYPEIGPPTVSVPGGSAGTRVVHVGENGAARMRAKIIVGGTGGVLRGRVNHKRT